MPFDAILGQEAAISVLQRALSRGRIHHAYRFEGPAGVGKELAAFAFAQALVCTEPPENGDAHSLGCGRCSACKRAVTLSQQKPHVPVHPDVVLVERGLYPPETIGRSRPELQEISVDQIRRVVLERTAYGPHEGRARVFIVRQAEDLSNSAANALLKTLEEPHQGTHFVLLTSRGRKLIDTIRSRTQLVRFAPLPDPLIARILVDRGIDPEIARAAAELSGGSASLALDLADPELSKEREDFADAVTRAIEARDLAPAIAVAEARTRDKGMLGQRLTALAARYARIGREALARDPEEAVQAAVRYEIVVRALRELERNAAPALLMEAMMTRLREAV